MDTEKIGTESFHEMVETVRAAAGPHAVADDEAREYAEGKVMTVTTPEQRTGVGSRLRRDPNENVIGQCLAQIAGRVLFKSFTVSDRAVQSYLNDFARKTQIKHKLIGMAYAALTDGSAAMSISWRGNNKGRPVLHNESWWDGTSGMFVGLDDTGEVRFGLSDWFANRTSKDVDRRTIYLPDRVLRYVREPNDKGWTLLEEVPWVRADGRPLGVPVVHFPNGVAPRGFYPPSTVKQVMAAQDELNGARFDRAAASALTGSPIYTATGVEEADQEDNTVGPGQRWSSPNAAARFGVIHPAALDGLLDHSTDLRAAIAAEFPVPAYRIGRGQWPSGLALARADSPMLAVVEMICDVFDPPATTLAHRAVEFGNHFGNRGLDEDELIGITWEPADQLDPGTQKEMDLSTVELFQGLQKLVPVLIEQTNLLPPAETKRLIEELGSRIPEVEDVIDETWS